MKSEILNKANRYNVSLTKKVEEDLRESRYDFEYTDTVSNFKNRLDKILAKYGKTDGTIGIRADYDRDWGGDFCFWLMVEVDKTEDELLYEIAQAEIAEQKEIQRKLKAKERVEQRAKKKQEDLNRAQEKERQLYESLKKKFEG